MSINQSYTDLCMHMGFNLRVIAGGVVQTSPIVPVGASLIGFMLPF